MKKRYYWIQIREKFFRSKQIKALRELKNGSDCVIIYQKMLLLSLENNGKLYFDRVKDNFYEELALEIDEDPENVMNTLEFLEKINFIEQHDEREYVLPQVKDLTANESKTRKTTSSTNRVRKHRAKIKAEKEAKKVKETKKTDKAEKEVKEEVKETKKTEKKDKSKNETSSNKSETASNNSETTCNKNETVYIDIEKEKDLDIDIDSQTNIQTKRPLGKKLDTRPSKFVSELDDFKSENLAKITKIYQENMGVIYPAEAEWFKEVSETFDAMMFKKAISICIERNNVTLLYLKGVIKKWISQNIFTLEDLRQKEIEFRNRKNILKNSNCNKTTSKKIEYYDPNYVEELDPELLEKVRILEQG